MSLSLAVSLSPYLPIYLSLSLSICPSFSLAFSLSLCASNGGWVFANKSTAYTEMSVGAPIQSSADTTRLAGICK